MGTANWVFNLHIQQIPYGLKLQMTFAGVWIMVFMHWGHFLLTCQKLLTQQPIKPPLSNLPHIKERRRRHKALEILIS